MDSSNRVLHLCLAGIYSIIWVASAVQTFRILLYRHSITSFQFAFHGLCFLWTILRAIFFATVGENWPSGVILSIYWYPIDIQFATFSLIVMYYAFLSSRMYRILSEEHKNLLIWIYTIANLSVFFSTTFYIFLACRAGEESVKRLESAHHFFMAIQTLGLVCSYAYYGIRLVNAPKSGQVPEHLAKLSSSGLIWMTAFIWLIFVSRLAYNLSSAFGYLELDVGNTSNKYQDSVAIVLLFFWEVIPSMVLLIAFRNIPKTSYGLRNMILGFPCFKTRTPDVSASEDSFFEGIHDVADSKNDDLSIPVNVVHGWTSPSFQQSPFGESFYTPLENDSKDEKSTVNEENVFHDAKRYDTDDDE